MTQLIYNIQYYNENINFKFSLQQKLHNQILEANIEKTAQMYDATNIFIGFQRYADTNMEECSISNTTTKQRVTQVSQKCHIYEHLSN